MPITFEEVTAEVEPERAPLPPAAAQSAQATPEQQLERIEQDLRVRAERQARAAAD
ncbi:hypothetical protein D9M69_585730 [compost metagenome]